MEVSSMGIKRLSYSGLIAIIIRTISNELVKNSEFSYFKTNVSNLLVVYKCYAHLAPEHLVQVSNVVSFGAKINSSAKIAPRFTLKSNED
jgi:hypothetical protein